MKKNTLGVESVNKALEILNCFTDNNEVLTVTKIANITGDHKSRISRISKSLENYGYIRKIKSGEFKIGHSISRLYEIYESSYNLKNSIKQELDIISSKTKEILPAIAACLDMSNTVESNSKSIDITSNAVSSILCILNCLKKRSEFFENPLIITALFLLGKVPFLGRSSEFQSGKKTFIDSTIFSASSYGWTRDEMTIRGSIAYRTNKTVMSSLFGKSPMYTND